MKRFFVVLAIVAAAGATYVAAAPGSSRRSGPTAKQFAALKRQVKALSTKVKVLQNQVGGEASTVASLNATVTSDDSFITNCLKSAGVVGVSQYGQSTSGGTYGYAYQDSLGNDFWSTALDWDSSSTPDAYLQEVSSSCVSSGGAAQHAAAQSERRQSVTAGRH